MEANGYVLKAKQLGVTVIIEGEPPGDQFLDDLDESLRAAYPELAGGAISKKSTEQMTQAEFETYRANQERKRRM